MVTSVQCLPKKILVHYQFQIQDAKSDYLWQLIVTREMVTKKIKAMKDNKSHGVEFLQNYYWKM